MSAWPLLLTLALAASAPPERTVPVRVLTHEAPKDVIVEGPGGRHRLLALGDKLTLDGREMTPPFVLSAGGLSVRPAGSVVRHYRGSLMVGVDHGQLSLVVDMPLEAYVAAIVASESLPGTPGAALRALAIVVRSYVLASPDRHSGARVCDLAHCQVLKAHGLDRRLRAEAARAARATAGQVLRLSSGDIAQATFHASCGGHTADPVQVFGGAGTGAASVPDPGCPAARWEAEVPLHLWRGTLAQALSPTASDVSFIEGGGGYLVQVASPSSGEAVSADAFVRALDGAMGWGVVRSSRFQMERVGEAMVLRGRGIGHGVGLCQAGASLRAQKGEGENTILAHYFPNAHLGRL